MVVQPTGAKSWAVRYRIGRRTRKLTLAGRYPVLSLAKAREAARAALESISVGKDPAAAKCAGTPENDTLAAYIALYREKHVSTVRAGTAANINRELERMQDEWPGRSLRSISKKDVVAVIDKAVKRGPWPVLQLGRLPRHFSPGAKRERMTLQVRRDPFASQQRRSLGTECLTTRNLSSHGKQPTPRAGQPVR